MSKTIVIMNLSDTLSPLEKSIIFFFTTRLKPYGYDYNIVLLFKSDKMLIRTNLSMLAVQDSCIPYFLNTEEPEALSKLLSEIQSTHGYIRGIVNIENDKRNKNGQQEAALLLAAIFVLQAQKIKYPDLTCGMLNIAPIHVIAELDKRLHEVPFFKRFPLLSEALTPALDPYAICQAIFALTTRPMVEHTSLVAGDIHTQKSLDSRFFKLNGFYVPELTKTSTPTPTSKL